MKLKKCEINYHLQNVTFNMKNKNLKKRSDIYNHESNSCNRKQNHWINHREKQKQPTSNKYKTWRLQ